MDNIIDYLKINKDKYAKESLIAELRKVGYNETDILNAIKSVYGSDENIPPSPALVPSSDFWDFKNKKVYNKASEKILDFFAGLFLPWVLSIPSFIVRFWGIIAFCIEIYLLILFCRKRRYMFYGLIMNFIIVILFVIYIL